jgi:hypothetical protein
MHTYHYVGKKEEMEDLQHLYFGRFLEKIGDIASETATKESPGEALPEAAIAASWLYHHPALWQACQDIGCEGTIEECGEEIFHCSSVPILSLFFSVVSVTVGIFQGCRTYL